MAAYATRAQLYNLGAPSDALSTFSTSEQDAALESASRVADGYLTSAGYKLPLVSYEIDLTQVVCKIAAWELLSTRGHMPGTGENPVLLVRYQDSIRWLERVASRSIKPQIVDASATTAGIASAGKPRVRSAVSRGWRGDGPFGGER